MTGVKGAPGAIEGWDREAGWIQNVRRGFVSVGRVREEDYESVSSVGVVEFGTARHGRGKRTRRESTHAGMRASIWDRSEGETIGGRWSSESHVLQRVSLRRATARLITVHLPSVRILRGSYHIGTLLDSASGILCHCQPIFLPAPLAQICPPMHIDMLKRQLHHIPCHAVSSRPVSCCSISRNFLRSRTETGPGQQDRLDAPALLL